MFGDKHPSTLSSINHLGLLFYAMGKLDEAKPLYEEALAGRRETLGDKHPDTLISIGNLARLFYEMGKLDEAESALVEAADGFRELLGEDHPDTRNAEMGLNMVRNEKANA